MSSIFLRPRLTFSHLSQTVCILLLFCILVASSAGERNLYESVQVYDHQQGKGDPLAFQEFIDAFESDSLFDEDWDATNDRLQVGTKSSPLEADYEESTTLVATPDTNDTTVQREQQSLPTSGVSLGVFILNGILAVLVLIVTIFVLTLCICFCSFCCVLVKNSSANLIEERERRRSRKVYHSVAGNWRNTMPLNNLVSGLDDEG